MSVGRTGSNELVIDDSSVSKIHASLSIGADDALLAADTGSTNGTFINDVRIAYGKAVRFEMGEKLRFGDVEVVFESMPGAGEPTLEYDAADVTGTNADDTNRSAQPTLESDQTDPAADR